MASDKAIEISFNRHNRKFYYPDWGDSGPYAQNILTGNEYPRFTVRGWAPKLIVDVGANIGAATLQFLSTYPGATIHCFEPCPEALKYLHLNTSGLETVHVHDFGLSSTNDNIDMYMGSVRLSQSSLFASGEVSDQKIKVEIRSASEAFSNIGIEACDIIKIDTEGCEVPILLELGPILDRIDVVFIEYHSENDRLEIDRILSNNFLLWQAKLHAVHRGINVYLSQRLVGRFPQTAFSPIQR